MDSVLTPGPTDEADHADTTGSRAAPMNRRSLPLHALRVFEAAGRHLSFTAAAQELGVTQGAVSYQVASLEEHLGLRLFRRERRQVVLTEAGNRLLPAVQQAFERLGRELDLLIEASTSTLTVAMSTYFASRWLSPKLASFLAEQPQLRFRLLHGGPFEQPLPANADMAIVWGQGNWSSVEVQLLFEASLSPICAPRLITAFENEPPRATLERCTFLHDDETRKAWVEWLALAGHADMDGKEGPVIPDPNVRVQAVIDGQGIALADVLVSGEVAAGRLVMPFDTFLNGYGYYVVYSGNREPSRPAAAFIRWLMRETAALRADRMRD